MINTYKRKETLWTAAKFTLGALSIAVVSYAAATYYSEQKKERDFVERLMLNELVERDYYYHGAVDCIASRNGEVRAAFMEGKVTDNPYYTSAEEQKRISEDGQATRRKLEARLRKTGEEH